MLLLAIMDIDTDRGLFRASMLLLVALSGFRRRFEMGCGVV
jgi:hypothetical protein